VYAVYAGIFVGLLAMFLLGLPADLAARGERQRLARRVRELERERDLAGTARPGDPVAGPQRAGERGEVTGADRSRARE
jgi:hypothetical protein